MDMLSKEKTDILKDKLKVSGNKLTPQRRSVLGAILVNEGKHLSTEEIYDIVKEECPEIGLATVYRTLQLFEEVGIVCRTNFDDGCNRYELIHDHEGQHHHLICLNCGAVEEVVGDLLENLDDKVEKKYNFKIINHSVKFFGYCKNCRNKEEMRDNNKRRF